MANYDLVVRGGLVVTAGGRMRCDLGVRDGRIVALEDGLGKSENEIDARGKLVLPGGIDSHCHIEEPWTGGARNADSFASATTAAAFGGTTTVIPFIVQQKGQRLNQEARRYHRIAQESLIDYTFHLIVSDPSPTVLEELPSLIAEGHRSIKVFLTYDPVFLNDLQYLDVLAVARECGALVTVHAENHGAIRWMTERLLSAGLTAPMHHAWAKPIVVEREATYRAIALAEMLDVPLQIFHVSGGEVAEEIARAQARGVKVFAETCPQYLLFTADDLDRPDFEGAKLIFSPAPRTHSDQDALWDALARGTLDVVSSDHAPFRFDDPEGKMINGNNASFDQVPNGVPGIETRMPVLYSEGVSKGRIDLETFVALTCTNPAKLFGLYPRKGALQIGADADIVIWDPNRRVCLQNAILHHNVDYTPYEGIEITGWPETTIARGEIVCDRGVLKAEPGRGQFLAREPYDYIRPSGRLPTPFDPTHGKATSTQRFTRRAGRNGRAT
ncbi:dihydropyrimidinase [Nitratireductor sp. GZWM139]|uniref:dihydropyrimidinase n=1 Tax=Nitratireductor sp. GZWM139 TaxID=2950541 RepID=UPI0024BDB376|nr:dihydropyrimidinase [Nitratireductor sp. GZWM139]MDJ1466033.1 dihydropyrimidinase [Nitratireductor sp. GZWM139]